MDRQNRWKAKPLPFGSQEAKLARADRHEARRRQQRTEHLDRIRDIQPVDDEEEFVDTLEDRSARLAKWKAERDLKKKLEAKNKRPAFKIGVPHHNFYSPTAGETKPHIHKKPKGPSPPKKISMVTQRRLAAKAAATGHSGKSTTSHLRNRDGAQPSTSTVMTPPQPRLTRSRKKAQENVAKREVSLAPDNYVFKIPSGVPQIPLFGAFIYPDAESAILDFNLNVDVKNNIHNDIHDKDELNDEESDESLIETKESTDQHSESMPAQITSPEKLTQQNSDKSFPIGRSQSIEASDSSIESIELRLSSQSEPPENDENDLAKTETIPMLVESEELPTAALPEESHTSQNVTSRTKRHLRNRNKPQLPTSSAKTPSQPRVTRSRRNAHNNVTTREISIALEDCVKASTGTSSIPLSGKLSSGTNSAISHCDVNDDAKHIQSSGKDEIIDKSAVLECSESIPSQINSPEKLTQQNSDKPNQIESSQSIQAPDSSIESVVLRMSSQSEPHQIDEDSENSETVPMNVDSDAPPRCFSPVPAQYSPFIVTSRGKSSARKEQKQRLSLRSPSDDIPMKDTVLQNLNISVEEEERTAQYYKFLVQREENRLREVCKVWEKIQGQPETSEDGHYMINQAIGQTNLLMRKKFERFRNLVLDCETGRGEQLVVCRDLQGFWAIVEREIRDCDSRFEKLEELKAKDWKEDEEPEVTVAKKKPAVMKKKKIAAKSNMRSFIEAARKKKLSEKDAMDEDAAEEPKIEVTLVSKTPRKTLLMYPPSPHSRAKQTPRTDRTSLLKLVQLTESAKRIAQSSFAIVKVSQKCKTPEVQHDQSITYVNSDQRPGRGILKKSEDLPKNDGKLNKSTCKVNFNDTVEMTEVSEEIDEDEDNRRSLAAALARIESLDFDHGDAGEEEIKANKKLEFEDDDADDYDNVFEDVVPSSTASEVPNDDCKQAVETTAGGEHCELRKKVRTSPAKAVLPITESTPPCTTTSPRFPEEEAAIKSTKIAINVIQATPIDEPPKNGERFRTEEAKTLTNSCERMPAPKLMKKGRSRRTQPVEALKIEKRSTPGRKKSHGSMETDENDVQDTVPSSASSKISDRNSKQIEAHSAENSERKEDFQTPPLVPVFVITVPTPSNETTTSPQSSEKNATRRRSKGKSRKSGTLKVNNVIIAGGVPKNVENSLTDEAETTIEQMPAPRLQRKCRNRRTEPVESENIENTSTRGRKKSLGNTTIEEAATKKFTEDKAEDSEAPVRRQTRNRSVLTASAAGKNCNTLKSRNSRKKGSLEPEELRCSDDIGDKENAITMDCQSPQSPTTPPRLIDVNYTPLRRSARKSMKFIPEDDCTVCKPVPLTPRSMKVRMSFFGDDNPQMISHPLPNGDLMTFDSPMPRRSRIRRPSAE